MRRSINPEVAVEAFERVSGTFAGEDEFEATGVFRGVLLGSWRYDFSDNDGHKLSGRLDDDLSPETVVEWNHEFFDKESSAHLLKTTVKFKTGRGRTTYRLRDLRSAV